MTTSSRWSHDGHDRERVKFRGARDVGEKIVALHELLSWTWFGSLWRTRIDDGERMDAKHRRIARGVRLLVHLHILSLRKSWSAPPRILHTVVRSEEEWRTSGNRRFPRGRACLWIGLDCGHCVQRMVRLNKDASVTAPRRAACDQC